MEDECGAREEVEDDDGNVCSVVLGKGPMIVDGWCGSMDERSRVVPGSGPRMVDG